MKPPNPRWKLGCRLPISCPLPPATAGGLEQAKPCRRVHPAAGAARLTPTSVEVNGQSVAYRRGRNPRTGVPLGAGSERSAQTQARELSTRSWCSRPLPPGARLQKGRAPIRLAFRPFVFGEARLNDSKQGRRTACEALGRAHAPANESTECSPRCRRPGRRGFCFRVADSAPPCSAKGSASAHPSASDCAAIAAP